MEYVFILSMLILVGIQNLMCISIGLKIGLSMKGEKVEFNPVKVIRNKKDQEEARREQERINTIMQNIEKYDGTPTGQTEVPWR